MSLSFSLGDLAYSNVISTSTYSIRPKPYLTTYPFDTLQRQEYKNLLRGRTTRLDGNRIQLLNGIGFAWQLQRGGRRRQLKARKRGTSTDPSSDAAGDGDHSSAASDGSKDGGQRAGDDDDDGMDGSCILPGEVLIGHGAPTPASPAKMKTDASLRDGGNSRKLQGGPADKSGNQISGPAPSSLEQSRVHPMQSSLLASSQLGLPISAAAANAGVGNAGQAASNNSDLLELVLARNALYHNFQRQAFTPSSLYMLGMTGTFPNLGSFQGFQQSVAGAPSSDQLLAAHAQAQAQASRANPMLHASMHSLGTSQFPNVTTTATGLTGTPANGGNVAFRSILDTSGTMTVRSEESKVPGDGRLQQQQQQQGLLNLQLQLLQQHHQQQQARGGADPMGRGAGYFGGNNRN